MQMKDISHSIPIHFLGFSACFLGFLVKRCWQHCIPYTRLLTRWLFHKLYLDWGLHVDQFSNTCLESLEIRNTPLLVWYYYSTVVWNWDKPLARRSWHANFPESLFCIVLSHCHHFRNCQVAARCSMTINHKWPLIRFSNTCSDSEGCFPACCFPLCKWKCKPLTA